MKKFTRFFVIAIMVAVLLSLSGTAFAASLSKTFSMLPGASGMGIVLTPGQNNRDSTTARFAVSGIPSSAIIEKVEVNVGTYDTLAGVVTMNKLGLLSSTGAEATQTWGGVMNSWITFSGFTPTGDVNGAWDIWFNASYFTGYYIGTTFIAQAARSHKSATLRITYR